MSAQDLTLKQIVSQAKQLPPPARLQLIKDIIETIQHPSWPLEVQPLIHGQFHGSQMSTEEDFELAEWRPTDRELDGD
jgi:hypothetical protein